MDQKQLSVTNISFENTNFNCVVLLTRCDALLNSTTNNYVNDDSVFSKNTNVSNEIIEENRFRRITRKRKLQDKLVSRSNDQSSNLKKQKRPVNEKQHSQNKLKKSVDLPKRCKRQKLINSSKNNSTSSDLNQKLEPFTSIHLDNDITPMQGSLKCPKLLIKIPKSVIKKSLFNNFNKNDTLKKIERTNNVTLKTAKNKTTKSYHLVKKKSKANNVDNSVTSNKIIETDNIRTLKPLVNKRNKSNTPVKKKHIGLKYKTKDDALNKIERSSNVVSLKMRKNKTTKSNNLVKKKLKVININNTDASKEIEGTDNIGTLKSFINKKIKNNTSVKKKAMLTNINKDDVSNEVEITKFKTPINRTFQSKSSIKKTSTVKNENKIETPSDFKGKDNLVVYLERCHFSPDKKLLSITDIANIFNYEADLTKDLTQYLENQINDQELKLFENLDNDHESQLSEKLNNNQESQFSENSKSSYYELQFPEKLDNNKESQLSEKLNNNQESQFSENSKSDYHELQFPEKLHNNKESQLSEKLNDIQESQFSENSKSGYHELQFPEKLHNNKESQLSEKLDYNTIMLENSEYSNIEQMLNEDKLSCNKSHLSIDTNDSILSSSSNACNVTNEPTMNVSLAPNHDYILATNSVHIIESKIISNDIKLQHFDNAIDTNKPCCKETTSTSEIAFIPSTSTKISKDENPPPDLSTHETVSNSSSLCEESLMNNLSELVNGFLSGPKIELNNYCSIEMKNVKNIQNQKRFIYPKVRTKRSDKLNSNMINSYLTNSSNDCDAMDESMLNCPLIQNDDDVSTKNIVQLIEPKIISNNDETEHVNHEIDTIEPFYTESTSLSDINTIPSIFTEISKCVLSNKSNPPLEITTHNPISTNINLCKDKLSNNMLEPQFDNVLNGLKIDLNSSCSMEMNKIKKTRKSKRLIYKNVRTKKLKKVSTNINESVLINNSNTCDDVTNKSTQKVTQHQDNMITTVNSVVPIIESTVGNEININPCSSSDSTYFPDIMIPSTSTKASKSILTSENDPPSDLNLLQPKSCSSYLTSKITSSESSKINDDIAILSEAISRRCIESSNKTGTKNSLKQNIKGNNSSINRKNSSTFRNSRSHVFNASPQKLYGYGNISRKQRYEFKNEPRKILELDSSRLYEETSVDVCPQTNIERQIITLSKRFSIPVKALYDTVIEEPLSVFHKRYNKSVSPSMLVISPIIKDVDSKLWRSLNCVNGKLDLQYKIEPIRESNAYVKTNLKDMIEELSKTMPSWSISIVPNPSRFVISHMAINVYGVPVANKVIVLDRHFRASVYINQCLEDNYSKRYTTATEIINLIKELNSI